MQETLIWLGIVACVTQSATLSGLNLAVFRIVFFATVYLTGQLAFERKLLMVSLAAPLLGALADLAFRPTRSGGVVLGIAFGIAAFWSAERRKRRRGLWPPAASSSSTTSTPLCIIQRETRRPRR
jgi:hypothetical protein